MHTSARTRTPVLPWQSCLRLAPLFPSDALRLQGDLEGVTKQKPAQEGPVREVCEQRGAVRTAPPEWGRPASQFGLLMRHREDMNVSGGRWASTVKAHGVPLDSLGTSVFGGGHVAIS